MMSRCGYASYLSARHARAYVSRGISVCEEWLGDRSKFFAWALANGYEDGLTLERRDVNGDYEPSNCTWVPFIEQSFNRRTNQLTKEQVITIRERLVAGEDHHDLATEYGISRAVLYHVRAEKTWKGFGPSTAHLVEKRKSRLTRP
jgi:hypothetical protein